MTELEALAYVTATAAHQGQTDKAGRPYIEHLERVARRVEMAGGTEYEVAAAYLHDIVEDTAISLAELAALGFPYFEVVELVGILTRAKGEVYATYIERIRFDERAIRIKKADLLDHLREGGECPETLVPRYKKALAELEKGVWA